MKQYIFSQFIHLVGYMVLGFLVADFPVMDQVTFFFLFLFIDVNSREKFTNKLLIDLEAKLSGDE